MQRRILAHVRLRTGHDIPREKRAALPRRIAWSAQLTRQDTLNENYGLLRRLVDVSRAPIFVWEIGNGILQWNRGSEQLYGYPRAEAIGQRKEQLLRTVVPGSSFDALRQELLERGNWSGELQHRTKDGRLLTVESQIELITANGRRLVLESTRDVTDQRRWERRQALLMNELTHRVKNTLAVVQSLARQTLRTTHSREDFVERFEGRLAALAGAHSLLVSSRWEGADVGELVRTQLEAHARPDGKRLRVAGECVTLPAELATPFGLVLHELATNAAKYGGFSNEEGSVSLDWHLERRNERLHLVVEWRETGGPMVTPPERRGFGGEMIERSLPGATVTRNFDPEGLQCFIDMPLPDRDHDVADELAQPR